MRRPVGVAEVGVETKRSRYVLAISTEVTLPFFSWTGHESYCGKTGQALAKLCTKVKGMKSCFGSCSPQCQGGDFPTNLEIE